MVKNIAGIRFMHGDQQLAWPPWEYSRTYFSTSVQREKVFCLKNVNRLVSDLVTFKVFDVLFVCLFHASRFAGTTGVLHHQHNYDWLQYLLLRFHA